MIEELTGQETSQDFTYDLRERINTMTPYPDEIAEQLIPLEALVIVDEINTLFTNHRVVEKDGKFIIPIATYFEGCRTSYTLFDECVLWAGAYGVDNIYVDKLSDYGDTDL